MPKTVERTEPNPPTADDLREQAMVEGLQERLVAAINTHLRVNDDNARALDRRGRLEDVVVAGLYSVVDKYRQEGLHVED